MRDLFNRLSPVLLLGPAMFAADNTPAAIDLRGFDAAVIELAIGVGGIAFDATNRIEFILRHGDTATVGEHVAVTGGDLILDGFAPTTITNGIVRALTVAHATVDVQRIGYVGGRRYMSLLADFSGTHGAGTPIAATIVRGRPNLSPPA